MENGEWGLENGNAIEMRSALQMQPVERACHPEEIAAVIRMEKGWMLGSQARPAESQRDPWQR